MELYQWLTPEQILINHNCKISNNFSFHPNAFASLTNTFSFITFRSCRHLDNKHTVFGKIVGGMDTLNAMEQVEVDNKDRPIEEIVILKAQVFVDPYQEADDQVNSESPSYTFR